MSRHEQIVAALIGAIVTGIFGLLVALISNSAGTSHADNSTAIGAAPSSSEPSAALAGGSPAPVSSPAASAIATMTAPPLPTPSQDQVAQDSSPSPTSLQSNLQYLADLNSVANLGPFETGTLK